MCASRSAPWPGSPCPSLGAAELAGELAGPVTGRARRESLGGAAPARPGPGPASRRRTRPAARPRCDHRARSPARWPHRAGDGLGRAAPAGRSGPVRSRTPVPCWPGPPPRRPGPALSPARPGPPPRADTGPGTCSRTLLKACAAPSISAPPTTCATHCGEAAGGMIGKISVPRGEHVAPLLWYLFGPGRREEHSDPHLVAGWRSPAELEPPLRPDGKRDFRRLTGLLKQPQPLLGDRGVCAAGVAMRAARRPRRQDAVGRGVGADCRRRDGPHLPITPWPGG